MGTNELKRPMGDIPDRGAGVQPAVSADTCELVVLSTSQRAARCRPLKGGEVVSFKSARICDFVPGDIIVLWPEKRWTFKNHAYVSGQVISFGIEAEKLDLVPLQLHDRGEWDAPEDDQTDIDSPPLKIRCYEMEQIQVWEDPEDPDSDPIIEAVDLKDAGDRSGAEKILMRLCESDLRCLDAHAHLGNFSFDSNPKGAARYYEAGVRIGELSFPFGFDGRLPWGFIDNRPYLRCLHGLGVSYWKCGRHKEAAYSLGKLLKLNPGDNQGARFIIDEIREGKPWHDE
jgi:hypothetical protein